MTVSTDLVDFLTGSYSKAGRGAERQFPIPHRKLYVTHKNRIIGLRPVHLTTRPTPRMSAKNQLDILVSNFQKKRPLRAGSLIITIYGDAIVAPGAAPSGWAA